MPASANHTASSPPRETVAAMRPGGSDAPSPRLAGIGSSLGGDKPAPGEPEAIFVVGVSRSGTTLMRRILVRHSRISIADENHFMGHLLPGHGVRDVIRRAGDLSSDETVHRVVELLYSPEFQRGTRMRDVSPFWRWLPTRLSRDELERRLLAEERSERGVFRAILRADADLRGRAIPGEKTPAHIRWVDELLEWYPSAKVVHMIRDPRAIYVSELKRRRERPESIPYRWLVRAPALLRMFVLAETVWAWADSVARYRDLRVRHPESYLDVRFERLVADPLPQLQRLCGFLGVAFEPAMLRQKVVSEGARLGDTGFDAGAADRWRERIGPWEARAIRWLLGRRL